MTKLQYLEQVTSSKIFSRLAVADELFECIWSFCGVDA